MTALWCGRYTWVMCISSLFERDVRERVFSIPVSGHQTLGVEDIQLVHHSGYLDGLDELAMVHLRRPFHGVFRRTMMKRKPMLMHFIGLHFQIIQSAGEVKELIWRRWGCAVQVPIEFRLSATQVIHCVIVHNGSYRGNETFM